MEVIFLHIDLQFAIGYICVIAVACGVLISLVYVLCALVMLSLRIIYSLIVFSVELSRGTCFCREDVPTVSLIGFATLVQVIVWDIRFGESLWWAIFYHIWLEYNFCVDGATLCLPQVISQLVWSKIFLYCS